ncbi:MAG: MFS transporter [Actinomycetota bacterium]
MKQKGLLRSNPDFARLYIAAIVSLGGDWFALVALQSLILSTTHSATLIGLLLATSTLPYAFVSPFAGVVADRVDRKRLMISADLTRTIVAIGFLAARSQSTIWIAFVCTGLISGLSPFFEPASSAALPNLVRLQDLAKANVLMGSAWGTMLAVGAALGGLVAYTLGSDAAFLIDAASFAISALLISTIKGNFREKPRDPQHVTVLEDLRIAVRFARQNARVKAILVSKTIAGLGGGPISLLSTMASLVFFSGVKGIGILMGARGVGALIGPFIFRRFILRDRVERVISSIAIAAGVYCIGYLAFSQAPRLWIAALAVMFAHIGGGANWALASYALQRFTPDDVRGRIFSFDYAIITLTMSIAFAAAGAAASRFGVRQVAMMWSLGTGVAYLVWRYWSHRIIDRPERLRSAIETE